MTECSRCGSDVEPAWARFQLDVMGTDRAACADCWDSAEMELQGEIVGGNDRLREELEAVYDLWVNSPEREEEWRAMTLPEKLMIRRRVAEALRELEEE